MHVTAASGGLRAVRKAAGVSQQKLAEMAGCSMSMVKLLESGYQPASSDVVERIRRALDALTRPVNDERPAATRAPRTTSDAGAGDGRDKP